MKDYVPPCLDYVSPCLDYVHPVWTMFHLMCHPVWATHQLVCNYYDHLHTNANITMVPIFPNIHVVATFSVGLFR